MKKYILFFSFLLSIISCGGDKNKVDSIEYEETERIENNSEDSKSESVDTEEIEDGTYSADVDYYNSHTGTSSTYTLDVNVRDGKLIEIECENGGWLDESHFTAPDITDGTASFTDDENREYTVKLKDF